MDAKARNLNLLRKSVSKKFGKEIRTANDCELLKEEISKVSKTVSSQTYRRFFRVIVYNGCYSEFTLNGLSQYCGFPDYAAFKNSLIENEMDLLLGEINSAKSETEYWNISEVICHKISESATHLANTHHQLLKYPSARVFFMEHHPMRDLAGTVYSQYFQEYLKHENSNEAKIFAYGFLYMGAFLTENKDFMEIYHHKIAETELTPEVYVLPAGRKFGVQLLHSWIKKDENTFSKIYVEMLKARDSYKEVSQKSVCSFEYAVLEHLVFTDKTEIMQFLIENNTSQLFSDKPFVRQDRKENHEECWKIMCSIAYFKMKNYELSEQYLNTVNLKKLLVGWKKYYAILYYFVKFEFAEIEEKSLIKNKISQLIGETHFIYYSKILQSLEMVHL